MFLLLRLQVTDGQLFCRIASAQPPPLQQEQQQQQPDSAQAAEARMSLAANQLRGRLLLFERLSLALTPKRVYMPVLSLLAAAWLTSLLSRLFLLYLLAVLQLFTLLFLSCHSRFACLVRFFLCIHISPSSFLK